MDKFYGNYRGEVIRIDDPLQAGRIKVRVFGVYDDLEEPEIPWAIYADPMMGGQQNIGSIVIPNIDSKVWCFFEGGEHHYPVYWAGAPAMVDPETPHIPEESRAEEVDYGQNKVIRTKSGFIFEVDDSEGKTRLRIKHPSGNEHEADHDGNVVDTKQGNETYTVEGDVNGTINQSLEVDVANSVTIRAPTMQFGEDSDVEQSVLGKKLETWINSELIPWINSHTHTGNLSAPTSPPIAPFAPGTAAPGAAVWSTKNTNQ